MGLSFRVQAFEWISEIFAPLMYSNRSEFSYLWYFCFCVHQKYRAPHFSLVMTVCLFQLESRDVEAYMTMKNKWKCSWERCPNFFKPSKVLVLVFKMVQNISFLFILVCPLLIVVVPDTKKGVQTHTDLQRCINSIFLTSPNGSNLSEKLYQWFKSTLIISFCRL